MTKKPRKEFDWFKALKPLFKKYKGKKHPLNHDNIYQLVLMVILSARDSDRNINALAPILFKKYPSMKHLAKAHPKDLYPFIGKVINFVNKANWLVTLAKTVKNDRKIPTTLEELTALSGI